MSKLKFIVSLMLALGLVACPDDEGDDETKITLKFDGLKDFAQGASPAGFKVTINKDDKVDKESKLKVKVEIACDSKKASKESTASEGVASFSASDFSGITWTGLAKDKECTATATAEGAEKATMKFKVTEASSETPETPAGDKAPTVKVNADGKIVLTNADDLRITLTGTGCRAKLVSWPSTNVLAFPPTDGFLGKTPDLFVVGAGTSCILNVGDPDDGGAKADLKDHEEPDGLGQATFATNTVTLVDGDDDTAVADSSVIIYIAMAADNATKVSTISVITDGSVGANTVTGIENDNIVWVKYPQGIQHWAVTGL